MPPEDSILSLGRYRKTLLRSLVSSRPANMTGASGFLILGLLSGWASAQFLNNRPFPTYSLENMPDTQFSCRDKILGGYYADAETQCQMFHVCVKVAGIGVQDFRFLCPNGTAFDQDHQICADWEDVDCDATTLYYSSDNFDLYRIGSGLESKAVKYGEDEETFALQRAETGDARLNREQQVQRVNQQKESFRYNKPSKQNSESNRDIFKGSSSSHFFNNRNGGKETDDDDYESGQGNVNQDNDGAQKRKLGRKVLRRPVQNNENEYQQRNNQQRNNNQNFQNKQEEKENYPVNNKNNQKYQQQNFEARTNRPIRPTGFQNNFAGSSNAPTTTTTTTTEQPTSTQQPTETYKPFRKVGQRLRFNSNNNNPTSVIPAFTPSTPQPFRQTQQYNTINRQQSTFNNYPTTTTTSPKETETYPTTQNKPTTFNRQYEPQKTNYPSTIPDTTKYTQQPTTNKFTQPPTTFNTQQQTEDTKPFTYETKKPTGFTKPTDNYPTTFAPKVKFFKQKQDNFQTFPTTFAPRTNAAYTQIAQHTTQYQKSPQTTFNQQESLRSNTQSNSTPKTSPYTQYTPTVPKVPFTSTTPVTRSNRFDETQYDDGSYYEGERRDDELIKAAHSQNIASSRNELAKKNQENQKTTYESPRPFAVTPKTIEPTKAPEKKKQEKNVSYDYAYYDTGSELEYDIGTEIDKVTKKQ